MKRIVMFLMSTLTAAVLLIGYHTSTSSKAAGGETSFVATAGSGATASAADPAGTSTSQSAAPTSQPATPTSSAATSSPAGESAAPTSTAVKSTTASASATVAGDVADTRWGPVQVQLTVQDGKITAVSVIQYPNNNGRDQEINATALPILVQETLTAQNAKIDMVSGATVTSDGYLSSLQSALDKAGL